MSEAAAEWLNRIGLVLDFLAFWLAAPELLGEEALKRLETAVEKTLEHTPWTFISVVLCLWAGTAIIVGAVFILRDFIFSVTEGFPPLIRLAIWVIWPLIVIVFVHTRLYWLLGIFKYKIGVALGNRVTELIVRCVLKRLEDDSQLRQRWLVFGAFLFVCGFLLQFFSTF